MATLSIFRLSVSRLKAAADLIAWQLCGGRFRLTGFQIRNTQRFFVAGLVRREFCYSFERPQGFPAPPPRAPIRWRP